MRKPLHAAPPRLQRMMLQLQKYEINARHIRGKDIPISDRLSRHFLSNTHATFGTWLTCARCKTAIVCYRQTPKTVCVLVMKTTHRCRLWKVRYLRVGLKKGQTASPIAWNIGTTAMNYLLIMVLSLGGQMLIVPRRFRAEILLQVSGPYPGFLNWGPKGVGSGGGHPLLT